MDARNRFGNALGRAREATGTPKTRLRADLGAPRASQERPGAVQKHPWASPEGSRTAPQWCPSAFGIPSAVKHDHGTIFGRFCIGAQTLRCAFRISFYSVLLASSELRHERVRAAKNFENQRVSASKIEPGSVRASQNRARAAKFEQQSAKSRAKSSEFFFVFARTSQSERESASCWAGKSANLRRPRRLVKDSR